jgi:hypothetical protein
MVLSALDANARDSEPSTVVRWRSPDHERGGHVTKDFPKRISCAPSFDDLG